MEMGEKPDLPPDRLKSGQELHGQTQSATVDFMLKECGAWEGVPKVHIHGGWPSGATDQADRCGGLIDNDGDM